jgi:hypothetical protein
MIVLVKNNFKGYLAIELPMICNESAVCTGNSYSLELHKYY